MERVQESYVLIKARKNELVKNIQKCRSDINDIIKLNKGTNTVLTSEDYKCLQCIEKKFSTSKMSILPSQTNINKKRDSAYADGEKSLQVRDLRVLYLNDKRYCNYSDINIHDFVTASKIYFIYESDKLNSTSVEKLPVDMKNSQETIFNKFTSTFIAKPSALSDDSFSCQIQDVNKQIIGVIKSLITIVCGFSLGFIGMDIYYEPTDTDYKLLTGLLAAFFVAIIELYCFINTEHKSQKNIL